MKALLVVAAAAAAAAACTVGPKFTRPVVVLPDTFRGVESPIQETGGPTALGDQAWWDVFQDDQLRTLIGDALTQNLDLQIAATRIVEARAQLGVTRADQFPTVDGGAAASRDRAARSVVPFALDPYQRSDLRLTITAAWELDFWGKYRRATEAARAALVGSEWGRRAVAASLVAEVAGAYFEMRALDVQLDLAARALASRREALRLTGIAAGGGAVSLLDVRGAEQLVFTAAATAVDLARQIAQQENLISVLLGLNPAAVGHGADVDRHVLPPEIPVGLPSALLDRRPDINQAEQQLIAANANLGIAKAALFPQVTLTGDGGVASSALSDLLSRPAALWTIGAALAQPIFDAGRTRSRVAVADAQRQQAVLIYQQTIQQSLREVADALVAYRQGRLFREEQERLERSAADARRLAEIRYRGGATSFLEVLDSDTRALSAQLGVAQAELGERLALVQMYRALGGGW
ncbi:MAG: efflux system, outer rane lipoprotein NodT [Acidobacteria bacterium]|nr:efflux system, outer rane lipoprotein NodT [Acidobacteriota bacterium]